MTCKVVRWMDVEERTPEGVMPGALKEMIFSCDADSCDAVADDKHIIEKGGLRFMGWWASGGRHYCPDHYDQGGVQQWVK